MEAPLNQATDPAAVAAPPEVPPPVAAAFEEERTVLPLDRLGKAGVVALWTLGTLLVLWVGQLVFGFTGFLFASLLRFGLPVGLLLLLFMLFSSYMEIIRRQYLALRPWTILQVRVPDTNERTPRAMEEVFNVLHGAFRPPDLYDIYLDGYVQAWLTCELRGTSEGVWFNFRIPAEARQLFEAAIYAQYPDAEILDADDYTRGWKVEEIDRTIDLWGTEFGLGKPDAYPIKTYVDFEDEFAEEGRMVDSMATITEQASAVDPGEEFWIQILFRPEFRDSWKDGGWALAYKLAGRELPSAKPSRLARALGALGTVAQAIIPGPPPEKKPTRVGEGYRLTPGERDVIEAIQRNVGKTGFGVKVRVLAVGQAGKFSRRTRIPMVTGIMRQFASANLNDLRPLRSFGASTPVYGLKQFRRRYRKRRLLRRYRERYFRERGFVLNSEELATLFHFPVVYTKTPTVEHARARKGEAPPNVPLGSLAGEE